MSKKALLLVSLLFTLLVLGMFIFANLRSAELKNSAAVLESQTNVSEGRVIDNLNI